MTTLKTEGTNVVQSHQLNIYHTDKHFRTSVQIFSQFKGYLAWFKKPWKTGTFYIALQYHTDKVHKYLQSIQSEYLCLFAHRFKHKLKFELI